MELVIVGAAGAGDEVGTNIDCVGVVLSVCVMMDRTSFLACSSLRKWLVVLGFDGLVLGGGWYGGVS